VVKALPEVRRYNIDVIYGGSRGTPFVLGYRTPTLQDTDEEFAVIRVIYGD